MGISTVGAVTSVGFDAVSACAAIRAGLTRPTALETVRVLDALDYEEVAVVGHPAGELALGFSNVGRWAQLAPRALQELCDGACAPRPDEDPAWWQQTGLFVVLPLLDKRFLPDPQCLDEAAIERAFVEPLCARLQWSVRPGQVSVLASGRTGTLQALERARQAIARKQIARAIVLAVDSLVDLPALNWMLELGRLKIGANAVGLSPGEAACTLLVEAVRDAARRGSAWTELQALDVRPEPAPYLADQASEGRALIESIRHVLGARNMPGPFAGALLADLNGEDWRARELGLARAQISSAEWIDSQWLLPLACTGDVGAASGALLLAVAHRAFARGYAGGDALLVTCSDDHGVVGAAVVSRPR